MGKRTIALIFIFVIVFFVGVPVLVGTLTWVRMTELYKGYDRFEQFVEIPRGAGTAEIGRRLVEAGVVRDRLVFRAAVWWTGHANELKAGEYRFDRATDAVSVVNKVARGDVYVRRVTFPEGLTIEGMARIFQTQGFGTAAQFVEASRRISLIADLDPQATDLEGYLFPDTYTLPRGIAADRLIEAMVARFRATVSEDVRARAAQQGLTVRQLVTLASLVEKETAKADERPVVAAVYRNRMRIGMPMQADPTVVYALERAGRYDGNIRRTDLAFDSPYNTYKYPGLPPGPIASPGRSAIEAALLPADVRFLYFVSRNDGTHAFATTIRQHNANVQQFQVRFFREQRKAAAIRR